MPKLKFKTAWEHRFKLYNSKVPLKGAIPALSKGLNQNDHARRVNCAKKLLANFTVAELGRTLYQRCYRIVNRDPDPLRAKVRPNRKPGRLSTAEQAEYDYLSAVEDMKRLISESADFDPDQTI